MATVEVYGYPTDYGPFPPGQAPESIRLTTGVSDRADKSLLDDINGVVWHYRFPTVKPGKSEDILTLRGTTNGWAVALSDAHGKNLMAAPFTNSMTFSYMEVYSSDLNQDGLPDFIVQIWSGGNGMDADLSEVTFLLSSTNGYHAASFDQYSFGKETVRFKSQGPVYFIRNDLISSDDEKTKDGRPHNFWVYELYRIDGVRFVPADADQPGFPKWIWFTDKANHAETTQLSQKQKARLLQKRNPGK